MLRQLLFLVTDTPMNDPSIRRLVNETGKPAQVILSLAPVFWGLVLLGVATWLFGRHAAIAALACVLFGAGYFVFAWSLFKNSRRDDARAVDDDDEASLVAPRSTPSARRASRDARGFQKVSSRREPRRESHDGAA
jgi:hypothetical protein